MAVLLIIPTIFLIDLFVKLIVEKKLKDEKCVAGERILLRKHHNYGAALNTGEKNPKLVLAAAATCSGVIIVYFIRRLTRGRAGLAELGLAFIVGGALNNLYDRISRGYVVDYFSFNVKWEKLRNIIFNISDIFIFMGAAMTVIGEVAAELKRV